LPEGVRTLLAEAEPAVLCTVGPDGGPRARLMWAGLEGDEVILTTRPHRPQAQDIAADPRVALLVYRRSSPGQYGELEGRARLEVTGADETARSIAASYLGPSAPLRDGPRIAIRVTVERAAYHDWA
jgi:PPOX class probable F420-dependent enzyme